MEKKRVEAWTEVSLPRSLLEATRILEAMKLNSNAVEHTPEERSHFVNNPDQYHQYRHKIESGNNKSQLVTFKGTDIQKQFWKISDDFMREKLKSKPHIYESLTPKYPPGCRRLTPGRKLDQQYQRVYYA